MIITKLKVIFITKFKKIKMLQRNIFIAINLIFGSILLYSYYKGIVNNPEIGEKLWGGVPKSLTPYIIYSMFISALGYFFFTYYILFKVDFNSIKIFNQFNFSFFITIYMLILIPSCFWIDLSIAYINNPNQILWMLICSILYTVGISSLILLISLYNIRPQETSILFNISFIGCIFFTIHTVFLDGLLWTIFFHK